MGEKISDAVGEKRKYRRKTENPTRIRSIPSTVGKQVEISGKQELSLFIGEYLQGKQNFKLDILEI